MADYFTETFTKEETILGLKCCYSDTDLYTMCPYDNTITDCTQLIKRDALNIITSQKMKIEKLSEELIHALSELSLTKTSLNTAKVEAYKEFVGRLKKEALTRFDWTDYIEVEDIDNVLKELIGDNNG